VARNTFLITKYVPSRPTPWSRSGQMTCCTTVRRFDCWQTHWHRSALQILSLDSAIILESSTSKRICTSSPGCQVMICCKQGS